MVKGSHISEKHKYQISAACLGRRDYKKKPLCKYGHNISRVGRRISKNGRPAGVCLFCMLLKSAKHRNISCDLTEDQFVEIINKRCIYDGPACNKVGVDRIDSSLGYTTGNCQPMCSNHNIMKNIFDSATFRSLCASVV